MNPAERVVEFDLDDPRTTEARRNQIQSSEFLRRIYVEWYQNLASRIPPGDKPVLELGSGAGFFAEVVPDVVTSDAMDLAWIDRKVDASSLPFADGELRAIVMTNVLHHVPNVRAFLSEAARCLEPGGRIVLLEPWVTPWSRLIYSKLHHEPFQPNAETWEFESHGLLSSANGALPWIVFCRDRPRFESEYPQLRIATIVPTMPLRYLLSGGLSFRSPIPAFTFSWWKLLEKIPPLERWGGMFAYIEVCRTTDPR